MAHKDYPCPRCGTINRVTSVPPGSTGFKCGTCGGIISLATGEAASIRPKSSSGSSQGGKRWWQFWK